MRPLTVHRLLLTLALFALASGLASRSPGRLPRIVFVSRAPARIAGLVPGVGPAGRALATGGRLLVRETDGRVRALLPEGRFFDVSDPAVAYDGHRIAFAACVHADSAWRIWTVRDDGSALAPLTRSDRRLDLVGRFGREASRFERYDDFDPCWIPDGRIVFSSTRYPFLAGEGGGVTSNLWTVAPDGSQLLRISTERQGAEEPSIDPTTGRIVFARWFLNRYRASERTPLGITVSFGEAVPADTVDLWHAISAMRDGDNLKLQGGDPRVRTGQMAYQPIVLADTTLVGVRPEHPSLVPAGGRLGLQAFPHAFAEARPLAGYGAAEGWSACSPAALPDGRILFSMDERGTGDFDLYVIEPNGERLALVTSMPGTLELDAAVLEPRRLPPPPVFPVYYPYAPDSLPPASVEAIRDDPRSLRFDCLNVFANGPVNSAFPDAPPIQRGLRIRFYTVLTRPDLAGGDSAVLIREEKLTGQGAVHVDDVPSDLAMFEQLVDGQGRVVRSAKGPAHVPGFNYGRPGAGTKCVGCHVGHSALFVAASAGEGEYTNVSTSAHVTASGVLEGTVGPRAAVDRRTLGEPEQIAWITTDQKDAWLRLSWETDIEARAVVVYPLSSLSSRGARLQVRRADLVMFLRGREVARVPITKPWDARGTRVAFPLTHIDALEIRLHDVRGTFRRRPAAAIAEVETIARLSWE